MAEEGERHWLVKDTSEELKAWGHPGGEHGKIIFKSDGEKGMVPSGTQWPDSMAERS